MNPRIQGMVVAAVGGTAAYFAISGRFLDYLKPGMRLPLLAAGATMLVLGALTFVRAGGRGAAHGSGQHEHHHGPSVAWLLVLPLVALVLVRPPALGADAARRDTSTRLPTPVDQGFDPLPPARDGAVDLTLTDFMTRSYYDREESLAATDVRLVGFVVGDPAIADGYQLTRFRMVCCAADAFPVRIAVRGLDTPPPPDDTWVEITGRWIPPADPEARGPNRGAALIATTQTPIPEPADPYE